MLCMIGVMADFLSCVSVEDISKPSTREGDIVWPLVQIATNPVIQGTFIQLHWTEPTVAIYILETVQMH